VASRGREGGGGWYLNRSMPVSQEKKHGGWVEKTGSFCHSVVFILFALMVVLHVLDIFCCY
jgi:hypothetical protein